MKTPQEVLASSPYVLLTTFRKDGTPVPTPVWVVPGDGDLRVWTAPDAGKVKRIRRNGSVLLAPCSVRGKPSGASISGHARMLPDADVPAVVDGLRTKYGLLGRLLTLRARRDGSPRAAIAITVGP